MHQNHPLLFLYILKQTIVIHVYLGVSYCHKPEPTPLIFRGRSKIEILTICE